MNIYDFIESPDIADYCRKIGHEFSPLDMAVIIDCSEKPLKCKLSAYKEIIESYPDMPIHKSFNFDARDSLHDFLRELIIWFEKRIDEFYSSSDGAAYYNSVLWYKNHNRETEYYRQSDCLYSTIDKALKVLEDYQKREKSDYKPWANIFKVWVDKEEYYTAEFNPACQLLDISSTVVGTGWKSSNSETYRYPDELSYIFIDLPVPFKKGDIVTKGDNKPRVLINIPHWYRGKRPYIDFVLGKIGDGSDMMGDYYYIGEDGTLERNHGIGDLYQIRYFTEELQGQERFLKYLSRYIKNKDNSIDWIINVFNKFKAEADLENLNNLFGRWHNNLD